MKPLFAILLAVFAATALAQQQGQPQPQQQPQLDQETLERLRTEGSAGGTRPPTEREKEGATLGAGPHLQFHLRGAPRERREGNSPQSSRDEKSLQSGNARPGADRP